MKAEDAPTPYPFREDAKLLWDAMAGLVQDFLAIHYPEEESCVDDPELQVRLCFSVQTPRRFRDTCCALRMPRARQLMHSQRPPPPPSLGSWTS